MAVSTDIGQLMQSPAVTAAVTSIKQHTSVGKGVSTESMSAAVKASSNGNTGISSAPVVAKAKTVGPAIGAQKAAQNSGVPAGGIAMKKAASQPLPPVQTKAVQPTVQVNNAPAVKSSEGSGEKPSAPAAAPIQAPPIDGARAKAAIDAIDDGVKHAAVNAAQPLVKDPASQKAAVADTATVVPRTGLDEATARASREGWMGSGLNKGDKGNPPAINVNAPKPGSPPPTPPRPAPPPRSAPAASVKR